MIWALVGAAAAVVVACGYVLRRQLVAVRVDGSSMEPTLRSGQRVLVRRVSLDRVRRGQVVVLAFPAATGPGVPAATANPHWLIKRVVAVPGDPVPRARVPALRDVAEAQVPAGHLVVLGDNEAHSYDSRRAGYFTAEDLLGVVLRTMHG